MDESFLSQPLIIEASRDFVCIRLTTYENESEHEFMKKLYKRNGNVENTTFAIMSADQKELFAKPNRSPNFSYRSPEQMAAHMYNIAADFRKATSVANSGVAPIAANIKIALNISASDKTPLVVAVGQSDSDRKQLEKQLNAIAWQDSLVGKFAMAGTVGMEELVAIDMEQIDKDLLKKSGFLVISPGEFGMKGTAVGFVNSDSKAVEKEFLAGVNKYNPPRSKSHFAHIQAGAKNGVFWETNLPVTDRMEANARERTKKMIENGGR